MNGARGLACATGWIALLWGSTGCGSGPVEPNARPNVVLITLDTTRADALGCYGQRAPTTPHIDRLGREGTLFAHAVTSSPSTLPSHATILTGRQPYSHGVRSNAGYALAAENETLAEVLAGQGYATAAEIAAPVIGRHSGLDQGFDSYRDPNSAEPAGRRVEHGPRRRAAAEITRYAVDFLRARRAEPFFLWVHYFDPHAPYQSPETFRRRVKDPYLGEVAAADEGVGRLVAEIEASGLGSRTLIVLTADHGEGLGQHDEESHSFFVWDTTMRVPLVFWGAGVPAGRRVESLVRTVDVTPTVLDLLGLPVPTGVQGVSLRPLLLGDRDDLGLAGYGESIEHLTTFDGPVLRFLRDGRWKYIHRAPPALYDVVDDPSELRNVALRQPETVARLRGRLRELLAAAPGAAASAVAIDADTRTQLAALGYAAGTAPVELPDELASLDLGPDDTLASSEEVQAFAAGWREHQKGHPERAAALFDSLWQAHPGSAPILLGLLAALQAQGRDAELIPLLHRAIEIDPGAADLRAQLAAAQRRAGDLPEARLQLRAAIDLAPCATPPRATLAALLRSDGHRGEALRLLEAGAERCPESTDFRNEVAWTLATSPDAALRDGARAQRIARSVVADSGRRKPAYLDTLAAAHAENGDFAQASHTADEALALLGEDSGADALGALLRQHRALFEAGHPLRQQ